MKKNCIWGFGYGFPYDEAVKIRVNELSNYFGIYLITTGVMNKLIHKNGNSIIFKRCFLGHIFFMIYSIWFLIFKSKTVFIITRPDSPILYFWSKLLKNKIIHIISNQDLEDLSAYQLYFISIFPRLKYIGTINKKVKNMVDSHLGCNSKTFLFIPEVNLEKYAYVPPLRQTPFIILFASAPMSKKAFENKGIETMLRAFGKFTKVYSSKLILIWRSDNYTHLLDSTKSLIDSLDINDQVEIINEVIEDMHSIYIRSHVTILVNKNNLDTPHYPLSLIESLSTGRPIITSNINEISDIVVEENVGSICNLEVDSVYTALVDCYLNYFVKQSNARHVAKKYFDISVKEELLSSMF